MHTWPESHSQRFDADVSSVRAARRFVRQMLDDAGLDSADAPLFTSELVSNAVEYAHTEIEVVVRIDAAVVRIEVHDGFTMTDAFRVLAETERSMVDGAAPSGRGLLLIRRTAVGFGILDKGAAGKAVWFELINPLLEQCIVWFDALTPEEQAEVRDTVGLLPGWMVSSMQLAEIQPILTQMAHGHPALGYLMPAPLMIYFDQQRR